MYIHIYTYYIYMYIYIYIYTYLFTPFAQALALQSFSRNCFPALDLVLQKLVFPRVFLFEGVFLSQTPVVAPLCTRQLTIASYAMQHADNVALVPDQGVACFLRCGETDRSLLSYLGSGCPCLRLLRAEVQRSSKDRSKEVSHSRRLTVIALPPLNRLVPPALFGRGDDTVGSPYRA